MCTPGALLDLIHVATIPWFKPVSMVDFFKQRIYGSQPILYDFLVFMTERLVFLIVQKDIVLHRLKALVVFVETGYYIR